MDGRPVLVATEYEDATADLVIAELNRRGVPVLRFDPGRDFPDRVGLSACTGPRGWQGKLSVGERAAALAEARALYHRRPSPYTHPREGEQAARFAAQENRRGLGGVLGALPDCLYLSHPQAIARGEYKPAQLAEAVRVGLHVPRTLITNEPAEAQAFTAEQPTLYKPLHAGPYDVGGEPAGIWAAPVKPHEIDDSLRRCAHLFQAQVEKTSDIRAVAVGEEVFCARISAPPGVVDWRAEYTSLEYESVGCPAELRRALLRFLDAFGLNYGAFDFAVAPDGSWWFLECNPNGQWAWLEAAADLPLTRAIADLLEKGK
ncbi:ATP-grasp ribosomal peptide maturase [Streptomyces sp. HNM0574]|uniref:ATP-grasp ribosomal peptide maturase n=1 Tax=Streptomyces sp. HNM0574 TaxID=2714954 RepID=UPI001469E876|nr:ATP-grasp ribosomal peptide maturase [Streptomyces sp. HNM0574]NLU70820.1 ATP-grasp ribosomal peptide maturase [Streptomyces sp. HNM0574]